jgi:hypothetical protein
VAEIVHDKVDILIVLLGKFDLRAQFHAAEPGFKLPLANLFRAFPARLASFAAADEGNWEKVRFGGSARAPSRCRGISTGWILPP